MYFSNESETNFIESQQNEPFTWFIYIDNIFFVRIHWEDKLKTFLGDLNKFDPSLKFTHESSKETLLFLDLKIKLLEEKINTDLYIKDTYTNQNYTIHNLILAMLNGLLCMVKH